MLLTLNLPRINEYMATAVVRKTYATEGMLLALGTKFLDLTVDLSALAPQDCPPISHYRIALRDHVWLRQLAVAPGAEVEVGAILARFSTEPDEPLSGESTRAVRITLAGIIDYSDWLVRDPT